MKTPDVTLLVVPRERFSHSERTLANIYEHTTYPFKLTYVSAGTPRRLQHLLRKESDQRNFKLISHDQYLSPNKARNLGISQVDTKYVVFLDNDALVTPGWLEALVRCAEETGAWVVGPVYYIGELERKIIHMAGGTVHFGEENGKRILYEEQYHLNTPLAKVGLPLKRKPVGHLEFHCLLVRADVFEKVGMLDEGLLSVHEHIDFCMSVRKAGGEVYLEPSAVTSYIPPPPCEWWDLPFFMLRWSDEWNISTVNHFNDKWAISSVIHASDKSNASLGDTIIRFARGHRRLLTGFKISSGADGDYPETSLEQAECMIAIFESLDRDCFDLSLIENGQTPYLSATKLGPQATLERLPQMLKEAEKTGARLSLRPYPSKTPQNPALIRLDDVTTEKLNLIKPYAFLTLETHPERYQCWIAIDRTNWRDDAILKRITKAADESNWLCYVPGTPNEIGINVRLIEARTGLLNTVRQLDSKGITPHIQNSLIY